MTTATQAFETKIIIRRQVPKECGQCGDLATRRHTYLLAGNARDNPASSAYGRDDCSWCSDHEEYTCNACHAAIHGGSPKVEGYSECFTFTNGERFKHMFVECRDEPADDLLTALELCVTTGSPELLSTRSRLSNTLSAKVFRFERSGRPPPKPQCRMTEMTPEWKCAGCGAITTDLIRNCKCITEVFYRRSKGKTLYETKLEISCRLRTTIGRINC